jgi:hypothetical protein
MRKTFYFLLLLQSFSLRGQIILNPQLPPSGIVLKSQLWNLIVTNNSQNEESVVVNLMITDSRTGEEVLGASTSPVLLNPGSNVLNSNTLMPIQYNIRSSSYQIDADQTGMLPPGSFLVCYYVYSTKQSILLGQECNTIVVEPMSPPQLILPENHTNLDSSGLPQFTWLPPQPADLFTNLHYDLYLVQIDSGQQASDAVESNIPVFYQADIYGTSLTYPASSPDLQPGTQYAWKVVAKNNQSAVSSSEVWAFSVTTPKNDKMKSSTLPFIRLQKGGESGYSVCSATLKFAYINEAADTSWDIRVFDISSPHLQAVSFSFDSIPMNPGLNLVQTDLTTYPGFIDKHIYLLELHNSRHDIWRMKFEYLRPKN